MIRFYACHAHNDTPLTLRGYLVVSFSEGACRDFWASQGIDRPITVHPVECPTLPGMEHRSEVFIELAALRRETQSTTSLRRVSPEIPVFHVHDGKAHAGIATPSGRIVTARS